MSVCSSVLVMTALTTTTLFFDMVYMRQDRIPSHLILGGIIIALFYALCQRGYETVNWIILLIIPVYLLLSYIASLSLMYNQDLYPVSDEVSSGYDCPVKKERRAACEPKPKKCGT